MKTRYSNIDIKSAITEIAKSDAIGLRVMNIYDIDNKTYLVRLVQNDLKKVILIESGNRIHKTEYDWPKNMMPSGFSMKCRKHLKGRRLAAIRQLGIDRIVDMQFGYDEAAYHLIVELYDRGNIILCDYEYTILQLLRVRTDKEQDVKFAVRERYPVENARQPEPFPSKEEFQVRLQQTAKAGDQLKRTLTPMFIYGPALLEHGLIEHGIKSAGKIGTDFKLDDQAQLASVYEAMCTCQQVIDSAADTSTGVIVQKKEKKVSVAKLNALPSSEPTDNANAADTDAPEDILVNVEYHPYLYNQFRDVPHSNFPSFNQAVDEFYSQLETQKLELKSISQEKSAIKKLENVRKDHQQRLVTLKEGQEQDMQKAELIELNLTEVDLAITTINSALANQMDWEEIHEIVKDAKAQGDAIATLIHTLKLERNEMFLSLHDPYQLMLELSMKEDADGKKKRSKGTLVEIDLGLTAFANARQHHNKRRFAANKEQKTIDASKKALKSAEQKTKEALKDVQTNRAVNKTRRTYWFEKFFWFISSENYLVVAGRDQQQNEMIVKRYLEPGDIYVHADLHGASSVVIKNKPGGGPIPPKTLNEAGTMATCYSAAWEARVVTSAWWVEPSQVSKTAPSGEYLTTGSFMIRGKKNYLPHSHLIMGYGVVFKLDESSVENHINDRKVRNICDDDAVAEGADITETNNNQNTAEDQDIEINIDDDHDELQEISEDVTEFGEHEAKSMDFTDASNETNTGSKTDDGSTKEAQSCKDVAVANQRADLPSSAANTAMNTLTDLKQGTVEDAVCNLPEVTNNYVEHRANDVKKEEIAEDDNDMCFPDTTIELKHVEGGKFELQRTSSSVAEGGADENDFVDLGDGVKINMYQKNEPVNRKVRMSAKQRRDAKKKKGPGNTEEESGESSQTMETVEENTTAPTEATQTKKERVEQPPQQTQSTRGQRRKQKKQTQKYQDQDEEDRILALSVLQPDKQEKPVKKKGKNKQAQHVANNKQQQHQQKKQENQQKLLEQAQILYQDQENAKEDGTEPKEADDNKDLDADADDEDAAPAKEEQDGYLDSLTGCPLPDDLLLYGVPVCAPYSTMNNYKFKVKVTPGSGKRGKAAKTAMHLFVASKDVTQREQDLLKILKDVDISRNLPGKVKVSAPNIQRAKSKK